MNKFQDITYKNESKNNYLKFPQNFIVVAWYI